MSDYSEQRAHQREMEKIAIEFDRESFRTFADYQRLQLVLVGVLAVILAVGGLALAAFGEPLWGLAVLVAEIAGLVLAFYGVRASRRDDDEPVAEGEE